jgi:ribonuclease G
MATEIAINARKEETRVAVLENRVVTELYIERHRDLGIVGNVYKGRVIKVLPGLQAAFVDIGQERAAFLYVADVATSIEEYAPFIEEEEEGGEKIEYETQSQSQRRSGSVHIEDVLQEGQEVLVQVTKEPMGTKGPRVTTYISLPGRSLVYMPTVNHVGVSRRIAQEEERIRLRELILKMRSGKAGYIVRTVSEGLSEEEFRADIEFLERVWQNIRQKKEKVQAPVLLHKDQRLVYSSRWASNR